ncbi:MAG: hypothetical protein R2689_00495 [Microthrixaceae bacterium]
MNLSRNEPPGRPVGAAAVIATIAGTTMPAGVAGVTIARATYRPSLDSADYIARLPDIDGPGPWLAVAAISLGGIAIAVAALRVVLQLRSILPAWVIAVASAFLGVGFGGCVALITAPATGANIGGGAAMVLGLPALVLASGMLVAMAITSPTTAADTATARPSPPTT